MGYTYNQEIGTKEMQEALGLEDDEIASTSTMCRRMQSATQRFANWSMQDVISSSQPASDLKIM